MALIVKYLHYLKNNDVLIFGTIEINVLNEYLKKDRLIYLFILLALGCHFFKLPFPLKSTFLKYLNNVIILLQGEKKV